MMFFSSHAFIFNSIFCFLHFLDFVSGQISRGLRIIVPHAMEDAEIQSIATERAGGEVLNPIDEEKPWHQPLQHWARLNESFEEETEKLVDIMHPNFPTIQSFDYNIKEIKRVIAFGLSPENAMIMLETDKLVKCQRTAEENRMWEKRVIIQRRIGRVVGRLKYYMYGVPLNSTDESDETTAETNTTPSRRGGRKKKSSEQGMIEIVVRLYTQLYHDIVVRPYIEIFFMSHATCLSPKRCIFSPSPQNQTRWKLPPRATCRT